MLPHGWAEYHVLVSWKRPLLAVTVGVVALLILSVWSPWVALRYRGDGKFSAGKFFSYPRYVVTFSDMPLYEAGERRFHLQGLPSEEMTLVLYVKGRSVYSDEDRAPLEHLKTTIEATLTDGHGNETCHASGQPDSDNRDGIWVLMSGGGESGYWHWRCTDVRVHWYDSYNLVIRVISADPKGERVVVTPTFEGGGLELP